MSTNPKWIDWDAQPLGKISDNQLARELGVNLRSVYSARVTRGIKPCRDAGDPMNKGINWDAQPLGEMSDAEIARQLGVTSSTVLGARRVRGIPTFKPQQRKKSGRG